MTRNAEIGSEALVEEPVAVDQAAREFAAALAGTPQAKAFTRAYERFRDDERAQEAMWAFQEQQRLLQPLFMLGAASDEQRAELERLREVWMANPAVTEYLEAQASLSTLSRALDQVLSDRIGLGFAAACRPSCCG